MKGNVFIAIQAVKARNYIEPSPWGEKSIEIDGTKPKPNQTTTTTHHHNKKNPKRNFLLNPPEQIRTL